MSRSNDLGRRSALGDKLAENIIENLVGRQRVLINLSRFQFGTGWFGQNMVGNDLLTLGIQPTAKRIDPRFRQIRNRGQPTVHISIEGAIADRHFRLVAG